MTRDDVKNIVWLELQRALSVILTGVSAGARDGANGPVEDVQSMVAGLPTIPAIPAAYPYGLSSRAPEGTSQVVGKGGNHPLNRIILGHYDPKRPKIGEGETVLYNQYGQRIRLENGKIRIGSDTSNQPLVLGTVFQTMMKTVLDAIASHTHVSSVPGSPTTPPSNAATFSQQSSSPVGDGKILSKISFTE